MMVAVTRLSAALIQTPKQIRMNRAARPSAKRSAQLPGFGVVTNTYFVLDAPGSGILKSGDQWIAVPALMYQEINNAQIRAAGTWLFVRR